MSQAKKAEKNSKKTGKSQDAPGATVANLFKSLLFRLKIWLRLLGSNQRPTDTPVKTKAVHLI